MNDDTEIFELGQRAEIIAGGWFEGETVEIGEEYAFGYWVDIDAVSEPVWIHHSHLKVIEASE